MVADSCSHFRPNHARDQRDLARDAEKPQILESWHRLAMGAPQGEGQVGRRLAPRNRAIPKIMAGSLPQWSRDCFSKGWRGRLECCCCRPRYRPQCWLRSAGRWALQRSHWRNWILAWTWTVQPVARRGRSEAGDIFATDDKNCAVSAVNFFRSETRRSRFGVCRALRRNRFTRIPKIGGGHVAGPFRLPPAARLSKSSRRMD
jgi:hypothetical protein